MTFLRWIFGFSFILAAIFFAVLNRHLVEIFWNPLQGALNVPAYMIFLGLMATGYILGAFSVWLNEGSVRRNRRQQRKQIKTLETKLKSMENEGAGQMPSSDFFPALPARRKGFK